MSDPNIKNLTVTGNAAESFLNKGGSRRRRRSSANKTQRNEAPVVGKQQHGGTSPGTIVQLQANKAPDAPALGPDAVSQAKASNASALAKTTTNSSSASPSAPAPTIPPQVAAAASATAQGGGKDKKAVKVILAGGKKKAGKVILSPAKVKKLPGAPQSADKAKTRKVAKKIRVSLHGLNKRVTRANHIRKEATKQPITDVKKTLVSAKLIKPDSKAPEDILRKMYADYMMLKNRAL